MFRENLQFYSVIIWQKLPLDFLQPLNEIYNFFSHRCLTKFVILFQDPQISFCNKIRDLSSQSLDDICATCTKFVIFLQSFIQSHLRYFLWTFNTFHEFFLITVWWNSLIFYITMMKQICRILSKINNFLKNHMPTFCVHFKQYLSIIPELQV